MQQGELRAGISPEGPYVEVALPLPSPETPSPGRVYVEIKIESPETAVPYSHVERLKEWLMSYARRHHCMVRDDTLQCGCFSAVYEEETALEELLGRPPYEDDIEDLESMDVDEGVSLGQLEAYIIGVRLSIDSSASCIEKAMMLASGFLATAKNIFNSYREEAKILIYCSKQLCKLNLPEELSDSVFSYMLDDLLVVHVDDTGLLQNNEFINALRKLTQESMTSKLVSLTKSFIKRLFNRDKS